MATTAKAALCFIISYDHVLNKEELWKEWIKPNEDIINVYFFYKDYSKIQSEWIKAHALPPSYICQTTYTNIIPAYLGLMMFALRHDANNRWFCFLTDSCCPIASPMRFRMLFQQNFDKSVMKWRPAWWNVTYQKRSNLALLPKCLHLGNSPYFILCRTDVYGILNLVKNKNEYFRIVCEGGVANESLFAICLTMGGTIHQVINEVTHVTDWDRMTSPTSPWIFRDQENEHISAEDICFIEKELDDHRGFKFFIRKVAPDFPDEALRYYIYEKFPSSVLPAVKKSKKDFIFTCINLVFELFAVFSLLLYVGYYLRHQTLN